MLQSYLLFLLISPKSLSRLPLCLCDDNVCSLFEEEGLGVRDALGLVWCGLLGARFFATFQFLLQTFILSGMICGNKPLSPRRCEF